jgi:hypothetical protein
MLTTPRGLEEAPVATRTEKNEGIVDEIPIQL